MTRPVLAKRNEPGVNNLQIKHIPASDDAPAPTVRALRAAARVDTLTAQHIEVAIVLHTMLGESAADEYLDKHRIDPDIKQRVLSDDGKRRAAHSVQGEPVGAC